MHMPRWINWLEGKASWISIPNLGIYLVVMQVMGFLLVGSKPELLPLLVMDPQAFWAGEFWRMVTFLTIPLSNNIWMIFILWFVYFVLQSLQRAWGEFKLTLYFLIAWLGTVVSSLVLDVPVDSFLFIESTFFFALATLIPDFEILLFFILPVKIKWIALFSAVLMVFLPFVLGTWTERVYLMVSCANYLLFFGPGFVLQAKQKWAYHKLRKNSDR